jgi:prepilin-type processing-associated H-X9-DG protein
LGKVPFNGYYYDNPKTVKFTPTGVFKCPSQILGGNGNQYRHYGLNLFLAYFSTSPLEGNIARVRTPSTRMMGMDVDQASNPRAENAPATWGLRHKGKHGLNSLFVDGHVQGMLSSEIPPAAWANAFWGQGITY